MTEPEVGTFESEVRADQSESEVERKEILATELSKAVRHHVARLYISNPRLWDEKAPAELTQNLTDSIIYWLDKEGYL